VKGGGGGRAGGGEGGHYFNAGFKHREIAVSVDVNGNLNCVRQFTIINIVRFTRGSINADSPT